MRIANDSLKVGGLEAPFSMGSSFVSEGFFLGHIAYFSASAVFTGTPNGSLRLEVSNDKGVEDKNNGGWSDAGISNWTVDTDSIFTITAAGDVTWNVQNCGYRWVRVRWTQSSSTGSMTSLRVNAKGI